MASDQELIETLRRNTKAQQSLAESNKALAESIAQQASAVHALADALAACTSDEVQAEAETAVQRDLYADGTPVG